MATNDFDSEAMLAFFAQLCKEIDSLKQKISGLNESGGNTFTKAADGAEKFGQTIKKHQRESIAPMTSSIKDLSLSLAGPVGLAYSIYKVGQSLETFAVGQIRMANFARDTGFTVKTVKEVSEAARYMGYSFEEASGFVAKFGGLVNDLRINKMGSSLFQSLAQLPRGGIAFANELERMAAAGKSYEEILVRVSQEVKNRKRADRKASARRWRSPSASACRLAFSSSTRTSARRSRRFSRGPTPSVKSKRRLTISGSRPSGALTTIWKRSRSRASRRCSPPRLSIARRSTRRARGPVLSAVIIKR